MNALAVEIGWRYARSKRSYLSAVSFVAVAGLALSVAVLLVVTSVVNGFDRELRTRILGVLPHLSVTARQPVAADEILLAELRAVPGVVGVAPFVQGAALVAKGSETTGVVMTGISPERHGDVSIMDRYLSQPIADSLQSGAFAMIIGGTIARQLDVTVGDKVTVVLPDAAITPVGVFPRQKRFVVADVLRTRSDLDGRSVFVHHADAARLLRVRGKIHGYQVRTDDLFNVDQVANRVLDLAGRSSFFPVTWIRTHGNLYQAIALQKVTMFVLLSFLVGVAAFNLVSTLVLVVAERRSDVAILQTLGGSPRTVLVAFLTLGGVIGALGAVIGLIAGLAACAVLPELFGWVNEGTDRELMSQYFINDLPVDVRLVDIANVLLISFVLCVISTLYPAYRATRIAPSKVLAHE